MNICLGLWLQRPKIKLSFIYKFTYKNNIVGRIDFTWNKANNSGKIWACIFEGKSIICWLSILT